MDARFHPAVAAIKQGDLEQLRALMRQDPALASSRSTTSHPTLLQCLVLSGKNSPNKLEMAEVVRVAMESLGERQRLALLLCKFENMSYQDIADTMDLSVKAVKSLLSRARVNLKTILEPYMDAGVRPSGSGADEE